MLLDLDLATAQIEQIRNLLAEERAATKDLDGQLQVVDLQIRTAIEADSFNEAAVRALASKEAAIAAELRVARARVEARIYGLLTPEQRAALPDGRRPQRGRHPSSGSR